MEITKLFPNLEDYTIDLDNGKYVCLGHRRVDNMLADNYQELEQYLFGEELTKEELAEVKNELKKRGIIK